MSVPKEFHNYIGKHFNEHIVPELQHLAKQHGWYLGVLNIDMPGHDKNIDVEDDRINALLDQDSIITGFNRG